MTRGHGLGDRMTSEQTNTSVADAEKTLAVFETSVPI